MKKDILLKKLETCFKVYVVMYRDNGNSWTYLEVNKDGIAEQIRLDRHDDYLVTDMSEKGNFLWFEAQENV